MKKKITKNSKKWKPKRRWIEPITINLKTGKSKYKYFTPKTLEEEKRLEAEFDEKMQRVLEIVFPNGILKTDLEKSLKENSNEKRKRN